MNYTQNYNLNQWEAGDRVQRTAFNADNAKIDAALAKLESGKAEASTVAALQTVVNGKGNCRIAAGTYVGTGNYGSLHPTALDFAGTLGKAPELLIVRGTSGGADALILLRGMTTSHYTLSTSSSGGGYVDVTWTDTGVSWVNTTAAWIQFNSKDNVYHYIAIG